MSDKYLLAVLKSQTLAADSDEMKTLQSHRADVEKLLRKSFEKCSPTIRYGGSKAKNTMIREAYDLDVICYFKHDDVAAGETLKDIYTNVAQTLGTKYLVEQKPSALQLKNLDQKEYALDFHIDVVPGRFTDDKCSDAFLYRSSGEKSRLKTNLDTHITHVRDSGVTDAIRLLKLWRLRNGLLVKHFVLELLAVELLKKKKKAKLTEQLEHVWQELRDNVKDVVIEDPANPTGNDLSELFNDTIRATLSSAAMPTLDVVDQYGWERVFGPVDEPAKEAKAEALQRAATTVATPTRPWSQRT